MPGKRYSKNFKEQVLSLGASGKTYAEIQQEFPIPKSTLSVWFSKAGRIPDRTRQLEHLRRARLISNQVVRRNKEIRFEDAKIKARKDASALPLEMKSVGRSLLAMLYWAEGGKQDGNLKFTNTDPVLSLLFLSLLRRCYEVQESRIRIALHVHHYHDHNDVRRFWSQKLNVPESQFWKIYVKKRSEDKEYRRNFKGICHIHYASSAIQRELLALGVEIASKVDN